MRHLIAEKRFDNAERWAREGIENSREQWPGIASELAAALCEVSRGRKQWDVVAAHAACQFFERPGQRTFEELVAGTTKAKCASRCGPQHPLPRNRRYAFSVDRNGESGTDAPCRCRLAAPHARLSRGAVGRGDRSSMPPRPHYDVLLDMAIAAKRPDNVLRWYDENSLATEARFRLGRWRQNGRPRRHRGRQIASPSGPWRSIGGGWIQHCPRPIFRPMNQQASTSRRCCQS